MRDIISVKLKIIFHLSLMRFLITMKKLHFLFFDELLFFIHVYVVYFQNCLLRRIKDFSKIFFKCLRMKMKKLLQLMHRIFFQNEFLFHHCVKLIIIFQHFEILYICILEILLSSLHCLKNSFMIYFLHL